MSKTYIAVQRSGQKQNELTHWKYIKRVKKNGKWRYYYDRDSLKRDIDNAIGINAKNKLENDPERLAKAEKELKDLNSLLVGKKISRSEYDAKIKELEGKYTSTIAEAGFDRSIQKAHEQYVKDNFEVMSKRDYDKAIKTHKELKSRADNTQAKADNYQMASDSYTRLKDVKTKEIRKVETSIRAKEHRIDQIKKSYETSKNIYDKSLLGYIDKGTSWLKKKLAIH